MSLKFITNPLIVWNIVFKKLSKEIHEKIENINNKEK